MADLEFPARQWHNTLFPALIYVHVCVCAHVCDYVFVHVGVCVYVCVCVCGGGVRVWGCGGGWVHVYSVHITEMCMRGDCSDVHESVCLMYLLRV